MNNVFISVQESNIKSCFLDYIFYFSSIARKERFERKIYSFINDETIKFKNKYHIKLNDESFHKMFSFILYTHCEKRGFKIEKVSANGVTLTYSELPTFYCYGYLDEEGK